MSTIPTCCVTGRVAGDPHACGDCDPCGAASAVPDAVKRLFVERDEWADRYADAMTERDEARAALSVLYADCADYIRVNNLYRGDGKSAIWNQAMKLAAKALGLNVTNQAAGGNA